MALVAIVSFAFGSCSNDDIQIDKSLTVKVNPAGVVASYAYEINKGELSSIPTSFYLRTRLLIYNESGKNVYRKTEYLSSYTGNMTDVIDLPNGTYTMVCISDVVTKTGDYEHWALSGEDELSQLRLSAVTDHTGVLLQDYQLNILGYEYKKVQITENTGSIELNMKAAGSLLCVHFTGVKKFSNIKQLQFRTNQVNDYVTFNAQGEVVPSTKRSAGNSLGGTYIYFNPQTIEAKDGYAAYLFTLSTDISMAFAYGLDGESQAHYVGGLAGGTMTATLEQGAEYEALLDLNATNDIAVDPVFSLQKK